MTAPHIINPAGLLDQALGDASPDLMRHLLSTVINSLLSAEADAVCGAEYGAVSPERVNSRNGYRHRELDTRAEGPVELQILGVLAVLVAVLLTGRLVDWFVPVTLRLLEGYWPRPAAPVRRRLVERVARRRQAEHARWTTMQWPQAEPDPDETTELVQLDRRLRRVPLLTGQIMPTRLGNVLRASESRPARKYGIDPVVCWPHLWVLLPDVVRGEVAAARARLDAATATVLWGALIAVWGIWSWWAVPVALIVAVSGYLAAVRVAAVFGDLVEAAWDLYRAELYRALRWPLPQKPADEYTAGRQLTRYLRRGGRGTSPTFG